MNRPQCEHCEVRYDDPQKQRNVKVIEEREDYVRMTKMAINQVAYSLTLSQQHGASLKTPELIQ